MTTKVALIGIGLMGLPMARRLLTGDIELSVWNRTHAKTHSLAKSGVSIADTPSEAIAGKSIVISMLSDGQVVDELVSSLIDQGAIERDLLWIDMSSTGVDEAQKLANKLSSVGAEFIDAPVSGGVKGAEAGALAIMAGATPASFERAKPVLYLMGRAVRVGEPGAGQVAKLANQSMVAAYIAAVSEATLLCETYGVDTQSFRDALRGGFADSAVLQSHGQRMADREFTPGAKVSTQLKDMNNVRSAANAKGLHLPLAENLQQRYEKLASDQSRTELDHSALFLGLLDINQ